MHFFYHPCKASIHGAPGRSRLSLAAQGPSRHSLFTIPFNSEDGAHCDVEEGIDDDDGDDDDDDDSGRDTDDDTHGGAGGGEGGDGSDGDAAVGDGSEDTGKSDSKDMGRERGCRGPLPMVFVLPPSWWADSCIKRPMPKSEVEHIVAMGGGICVNSLTSTDTGIASGIRRRAAVANQNDTEKSLCGLIGIAMKKSAEAVSGRRFVANEKKAVKGAKEELAEERNRGSKGVGGMGFDISGIQERESGQRARKRKPPQRFEVSPYNRKSTYHIRRRCQRQRLRRRGLVVVLMDDAIKAGALPSRSDQLTQFREEKAKALSAFSNVNIAPGVSAPLKGAVVGCMGGRLKPKVELLPLSWLFGCISDFSRNSRCVAAERLVTEAMGQSVERDNRGAQSAGGGKKR